MKKWINYIAAVGLTAGAASAAWPFGSENKVEQTPATSAKVIPATPSADPETSNMKRAEGKGDQQKQLSPEQKEKIKARHEELKNLGEAARNETDPAKKDALVGQLRAKLTEMADERLADKKKRIDNVEKDISELKENLEKAVKNKSANIEKQLQRILAGEPIDQPKGASKKEGKKGAKAPAAK
ncbi:MAG: hypothetical protein WCH86_07110 [Kiritimatiellales bacterium]